MTVRKFPCGCIAVGQGFNISCCKNSAEVHRLATAEELSPPSDPTCPSLLRVLEWRREIEVTVGNVTVATRELDIWPLRG